MTTITSFTIAGRCSFPRLYPAIGSGVGRRFERICWLVFSDPVFGLLWFFWLEGAAIQLRFWQIVIRLKVVD